MSIGTCYAQPPQTVQLTYKDSTKVLLTSLFHKGRRKPSFHAAISTTFRQPLPQGLSEGRPSHQKHQQLSTLSKAHAASGVKLKLRYSDNGTIRPNSAIPIQTDSRVFQAWACIFWICWMCGTKADILLYIVIKHYNSSISVYLLYISAHNI